MKKLNIIISTILLFLVCQLFTLIVLASNQKEEEFKELVQQINPSTTTSNTDTRTVYLTSNGSKYHISGCDEMTSRPYKTTVSEAENRGYSPCKVCNPYGLATEFYGISDNGNTKIFYFILGIVIISITYMIVPLICKFKRIYWKSYYSLNKCIIINSIIASLVVLLLIYLGGGISIFNIIEIIIFGFIFKLINYKILENNLSILTDGLFTHESIPKSKKSKLCKKHVSPDEREHFDTKLPMYWFKFWMYFRFPLGIIFTISNLINLFGYQNVNATLSLYIVLDSFINVIWLVLTGLTYYCFLKQYKSGYKLVLIILVLQPIVNTGSRIIYNDILNNSSFSLSSFLGEYLIILLIETVIWIIPNYIYFKKRKGYFYKNFNTNT